MAGLGLTAQGAVTGSLVDLTDAVPGADLWRGSFVVSGVSFQAGSGFAILFAPDLYRDLSVALAPVNTGWNMATYQPDAVLHLPGLFDGLALVDNPDLTQPFVLEFVWQGPGVPGAQPFEIYDLSGGFTVTDRGTVSPIPEPAGTTAVVLCGLGVWIWCRARWRVRGHDGSAARND